MSHVRRFGLAIVWVLLFANGAAAQTSGAVEASTAALRARNFAQAAERSRAELLKAPNDVRLWTLSGLALAGAGKRAEAIQSFQRALKIDPKPRGRSRRGASGGFCKAISQQLRRSWQIGAHLTF
jgi:cytochrome c-type biogenesis protein CcmH/NrfG